MEQSLHRVCNHEVHVLWKPNLFDCTVWHFVVDLCLRVPGPDTDVHDYSGLQVLGQFR